MTASYMERTLTLWYLSDVCPFEWSCIFWKLWNGTRWKSEYLTYWI